MILSEIGVIPINFYTIDTYNYWIKHFFKTSVVEKLNKNKENSEVLDIFAGIAALYT